MLKGENNCSRNVGKQLVLWITALILVGKIQAQSSADLNWINHTHGIIQEETTFFNMEGYNVFVKNYQTRFDEKGFNRIKRVLTIPKSTKVESLKGFENVHYMEYLSTDRGVKINNSYYLTKSNTKQVQVIGFSTPCTRDLDLEYMFVRMFTNDSLPDKIFEPMVIDSISFAGRYIKLGPACNWGEPCNVYCTYRGQFNWSEFGDKQRAFQMLQAQKAWNDNAAMGEIIKDEEVEVEFEGNKVIALKRHFKPRVPRLLTDSDNMLIIYYVLSEVRGRFVSCTLSYFENEAPENSLPPLLNEVMSLSK